MEGLLQEHCDRIRLSSGKGSDIPNDVKSIEEVKDVNMDECEDPYLDGSVMEKVLQRRSLRMRNMQRAWQVIRIMLHIELLDSPFHVLVTLNNRNSYAPTPGPGKYSLF